MSIAFRILALTSAACLAAAGPALAQTAAAAQQAPASAPRTSTAPEKPWTFDFGIGWDNSISGNINAGAIGSISGQATAILPHRYQDAYGTGLYMRFAGGYKVDELNEIRGSLTFQSLDADLVVMGDIGTSKLYGQYDPYKSLTLDVGWRRYAPSTIRNVRFYAEGSVGLGFISEIDVELAAPGSNAIVGVTDFYDATAAFTLGAHTGVLFTIHKQLDLNAQIGLRYMTGLSEVDNLVGTGLEKINTGTRRWTVPFTIGTSVRF